MRRPCSLPLLVAYLVILSAGSPSLASALSWFCDGRLCGALRCCCEQPDPRKSDPNCQRTRSGQEGSALCAADCGCTLGFTTACDTTPYLVSGAPTAPFPALALAPRSALALSIASLPRTVAVLPDERGPPIPSPALPASGLRAPPAS